VQMESSIEHGRANASLKKGVENIWVGRFNGGYWLLVKISTLPLLYWN